MENEKLNTENPNVAEMEEQKNENQEVNPENKENAGAENAATENESAAKDAEIAHLKDSFVRILAEFENYKKRTAREKAELVKFASQELMTALLPTLDDFERAMGTMEKTDNLSAIKDGLRMISENFFRVLEKQGLEPIDAKGLEFDSNFHEAIASVPVEDEGMKGKVLDVVEKGYKMKEKVIRFSRVVVGE